MYVALSAAVRRLAALMQQEEQQAEQEQQAVLQRQRDRAAAAQKAAQESGIDPKTKRQYEYVTRKFAAWLEVHGDAVLVMRRPLVRRSRC